MRTSIPIFVSLGLSLGLVGCGDNSGTGASPDAALPGVDAPTATIGLTLYDYTRAVDVSPDGRIAAFEDVSQGLTSTLVFVDTATGVATPKTEIGDVTRDFASGLSNNGRVTALHGDPVQAGVWSEATGWIDLPAAHPAGCDADIAGAWDISADGAVVVGLAWNGCDAEAFRWTDTSGTGVYTTLDVIGKAYADSTHPPTNRATVISDDGKVIAGFAQNDVLDRSAAMWTADGHGVLLDPANLDAPSEILAIDADGSTLAGIVGFDGFVWTKADGQTPLVRFDSALPSDRVYPNAITADGATVFGGVGDPFSGIPVAFVWTKAAGMRPLIDVATAAGVSIPTGTILNSVLGASADGTVLVGTAMDAAGNGKTFALVLPASALAP
ncbi:MAG: hypothetical protein K8W52_04860 [Deltaproteobacteria bacterium]|nr:hypothetical protein [Deltaproteobacteria bacterium]